MLSILYRASIDALFVLAAASFVALLFLSAPYGRYARPGWGLTLRERLGWQIMEFPAVAVIFLCFLFGGRFDPVSLLFVALWELHYVYRTFIFTARMREGTKEFPAAITAMAILFNLLNGYANGFRLFLSGVGHSMSWLWDVRLLAGLLIFVAGFVMHVGSDKILRNLRKPGETGYFIPSGGMFRFVSCPNYLGEILQWSGWALLTWSLSGVAFAVFTFANLFPRALTHHRWYRNEFPDYPAARRAIIPFLI